MNKNKKNMSEEIQIIQTQQEIIHRAEVESQMDIARRYPRNLEEAKKQLLEFATVDEETAKSCFYVKPVGKDDEGDSRTAEGPSIRLAEIVAATYGNIAHGTRIIEIGNTFIKVQGMCKDLQKNNSSTAEVTRSIVTKKGYKYSPSLIETTTKAAQAIALRDAIFKVVPLALFKKEMNEIKRVAAGSRSGKPLNERVLSAIKHFKTLGVSEERVLERLGVQNKEAITEDHLVTLVGLANAIKDLEATVEECFPKTATEANAAASEQNLNEIKNRMKNNA